MNYGKILRLQFDGKVYHVNSQEKDRFRLINGYGEYIYPVDVTYGANDHEVYLHFDNINNLVFPAYLERLQTHKMGSEYVSFGPLTTEIFLDNLWPIPGFAEHAEVSSVSVAGLIAVAFDGKAYFAEYAQVSNVSITGSNQLLTFTKGYFAEYAQITGVTFAGQYCDINGNPL